MQKGKKFLVLFFCLIFSLKGMEYFQKLGWEKQWVDASSPDAFRDPNSGEFQYEFQISYKGQGIYADGVGWATDDLNSPLPALGFYRRAWPYLFRTRYLLVQFDPVAAWKFLPSVVKKVLEPTRKTPGFSMRGVIAVNAELYTKVPITAVSAEPAKEDATAAKSRLVNILYHAWVGEILNKEKNNDYKVALPMGIFEPDGVERYTPKKFDLPKDYAEKRRGGVPLLINSGIEFGKLGNQTVHYHRGYSPDDAVFVVSLARDLVTFWSIAIYENKHALVTFHILINDADLENIIGKSVIRYANRLRDILVALQEKVLPNLSKQTDKNALRNAIIVIRDLIGGTYPPRTQEELLLQSLQNLKKALYQVQRFL